MILLKFVSSLALVFILVDFVQSHQNRDSSEVISNNLVSISYRNSVQLREARSEENRRTPLYYHDVISPTPQVPLSLPEHAYRGSEEYGSRSHLVPEPPMEFQLRDHNRFVEDMIINQTEEDYPTSTITSTTIVPNFVHGKPTRTWEDAVKFCEEERHGKLACLQHDLIHRVISDAKKFMNEEGLIYVFSYSLDCSRNDQLFNAAFEVNTKLNTSRYALMGDSDKLPFYCVVDEEVTTSTGTNLYDMTTIPTETTSNSNEITTTNASLVNTTETFLCCETVKARNLTWTSTCENQVVVQKCPIETTGNALWSCDTISGKWYPKTPDLSGCVTDVVGNLLQSINTSDIPGMYNTFYHAALHASTGGDIITIVDVTNNVTFSLIKPGSNITDEEWLDMLVNVTDNLANVVSSFLNSTVMWTDIPEKDRVEAAETLMETLKYLGFTLIHAMNDSAESTLTIAKDNVFLQAIKREKGWYTDKNLSLPLSDGSSNLDGILSLTAGFENDIPVLGTNNNHTFVLFTTLSHMEDILIVREENSFENRTEKTKVNSAVLSIDLVENDTVSIPLSSDVRFTVAHKNKLSDSPVCAYWNFHVKNWDVDGCWIVDTNSTHTTCACNHLTNFAILMDMHGALDIISDSDKRALTVITYIGCIVSIVALAVCVFLTTLVRQLWCIRNTIHRNLALCLLIAEVFLLTGLERTENKTLCSVVAGCLHYFFLATFSWMLLESVYIYMLLCKVFQPRRTYTERYYFCGYGLPLLIVAISAGANPKGYGTEKYCWLSVEKGMTWSFGLPVLIIITVNFIALVFALKTAIVISKKKHDPEEAAAKKWIFGALTLVPLLGLTWGVGFLFWKDSGAAGAYIFTILNSFQGVAIFVVQVIMNKKVRDIIRRKLSGSFRQVAPLSNTKSGSSGNNRTTSTSNGRRSNRSSANITNTRDRADSSVSKTFNCCPKTPIQFINDVNNVIRSSVTGTRSYDVATSTSSSSSGNSRRNNKTKTDIVGGYNPRKNAVIPTTPAVLRLSGQESEHLANTVI